jgi:stage II sporulation protein AA (anti-sigma F factor antagonist)
MAKNFRALSKGINSRSVRIQLQGDFDGTSAHELANILNTYDNNYPRVTIDTEGLKSINAFGLDVFIIRLKSMRRSYARIVFTGKFKANFVQE